MDGEVEAVQRGADERAGGVRVEEDAVVRVVLKEGEVVRLNWGGGVLEERGH